MRNRTIGGVRFAYYALLLSTGLLSACVPVREDAPSGANLTPDAAEDYFESIADMVDREDGDVIVKQPLRLAVRLDNAADLVGQAKLRGLFVAPDPSAPPKEEGVTESLTKYTKALGSLFSSSSSTDDDSEAGNLSTTDRFIKSLGTVLSGTPRYKAGFLDGDIEHLDNREDATTRRLWDLSARVLGRAPSAYAAETLVVGARTQLAANPSLHYLEALARQQDNIRANPQLHIKVAKALLQSWMENPGGKRERWFNALNARFLTAGDLNRFWLRLNQGGSSEAALLSLAGHRLAELRGRSLSSGDLRNTVSGLRSKIQDASDRRLRGETLAPFFPVAYFDELASQTGRAGDHTAMSELVLALRLMELQGPDSAKAEKDEIVALSQLGDYQPFAVNELGVSVPDGRARIAGSVHQYLSREPRDAAARGKWVYNVTLLMVGHPQALLDYFDASEGEERPGLMLATAQVLARHWHPQLYQRLQARLSQFKDRYDTAFYSRLMSALSEGEVASRGASFLDLQRDLIKGGDRGRALTVLRWSSAVVGRSRQLSREPIRALAETAFELGITADEASLPALIPHAPMDWLLDQSILAAERPVSFFLVERAIRNRPLELQAMNLRPYIRKLLSVAKTAPDTEAIPAARLASLLAENGGTQKAEVAQFIRGKWLQ